MSALHDLVETSNDIERLRELLAGGEILNSQDAEGRTPLHIAVLKSEINPQDRKEILLVASELIKFGANVNLEDNVGCTPLHLATMCRNYKMILVLLRANAEINKKDNNGQAALHYATTRCSFRRMDENVFYDPEIRVVNLLLKYQPNLDIRNYTDETPLMLAVRNSNLHIVRELLNKNACVYCQDSYGDSALHYALNLQEVNVDIVSELARHGCRFNMNNDSGVNPRDAYFNKLDLNPPRAEVEKAKHVIKLFMLHRNVLNDFEDSCITKISKENEDCELPRFLDLCYNEITEMREDKISTKHWVSNIAYRGAFYKAFEKDNQVPVDGFENLLEKLMRRQYPVYCDVIAAGICSHYMKIKFAEECCNIKTVFNFFDFDVLSLVSCYLSHFDMLKMMIACSGV